MARLASAAPSRSERCWRAVGAILLVSSLNLALASGARAGLGGAVASVERDGTLLKATSHAVTPMASYQLHEMTTPDGVRVREYVSQAGTVFGVAWDGLVKPDLSVLLGQHYGDFSAALAARRTSNHKVFTMASNGIVVSIVKLPRGFRGSASVASLLPSGMSARDVR